MVRSPKSIPSEDPLEFIKAFQQRYQVPELPELPRFTGGLVGYFGYDTVRYIEPRLLNSMPEDELNTPDILLMVSDELVVFDNLSGKLILITHANPEDSAALEKAEFRLDNSGTTASKQPCSTSGSGFSESSSGRRLPVRLW